MVVLVYIYCLSVLIVGFIYFLMLCVCYFKNRNVSFVAYDSQSNESLEIIARELVFMYPKAEVIVSEGDQTSLLKRYYSQIITHQDF